MLSNDNTETLSHIVRSNKCRLVIFDFGGTIYDFTPVHIECFAKALDGYGFAIDEDKIGDLVTHSIRTGEDSFLISNRLVQDFSLTLNPRDLAVRKRLLVEEQIASTRLGENSKNFIHRLIQEQIGVAIITRGMQMSARRILENTWPEAGLAAEIPIFGRTEISEVVDKRLLLLAALAHFGLPASHSIFVGDSTEDEEIARLHHLMYFDVDSS